MHKKQHNNARWWKGHQNHIFRVKYHIWPNLWVGSIICEGMGAIGSFSQILSFLIVKGKIKVYFNHFLPNFYPLGYPNGATRRLELIYFALRLLLYTLSTVICRFNPILLVKCIEHLPPFGPRDAPWTMQLFQKLA